MSEINLKKKDVSVLAALRDLNWDTNTRELRRHINNRRNDLKDVDLSNINYRVNTKFNYDAEDSDYRWVETRDMTKEEIMEELDLDDIKGAPPKKIIGKDEEGINEALEQNKGLFVENYEDTEHRVKELDKRSEENAKMNREQEEQIENLKKQSDENKRRISSNQNKTEKMIKAIAILSNDIGNSELRKITRVADEDDDLTLKDLR